MTHFIQNTIVDMRMGRESWRVFATLGSVAFTVAVALRFL